MNNKIIVLMFVLVSLISIGLVTSDVCTDENMIDCCGNDKTETYETVVYVPDCKFLEALSGTTTKAGEVPTCDRNTDCANYPDAFCKDNICYNIQCWDDDECDAGEICSNYLCVEPCEEITDCDLGYYCNDNGECKEGCDEGVDCDYGFCNILYNRCTYNTCDPTHDDCYMSTCTGTMFGYMCLSDTINEECMYIDTITERCDSDSVSCTTFDYDEGDANCKSTCMGYDLSTCEYTTSNEICYDGINNDEDGKVDCADTDCLGKIANMELNTRCETPEITCNDGFDNDRDGLTDCDDTDCYGVSCHCPDSKLFSNYDPNSDLFRNTQESLLSLFGTGDYSSSSDDDSDNEVSAEDYYVDSIYDDEETGLVVITYKYSGNSNDVEIPEITYHINENGDIIKIEKLTDEDVANLDENNSATNFDFKEDVLSSFWFISLIIALLIIIGLSIFVKKHRGD